MAQTVTVVRDFPLSDNTVVEWTRGHSTEYVIARGIHITERQNNFTRKLYTGEVVTCYWNSGTYFTDKDPAIREAIKREQEALETLAEIYAEPATERSV